MWYSKSSKSYGRRSTRHRSRRSCFVVGGENTVAGNVAHPGNVRRWYRDILHREETRHRVVESCFARKQILYMQFLQS